MIYKIYYILVIPFNMLIKYDVINIIFF